MTKSNAHFRRKSRGPKRANRQKLFPNPNDRNEFTGRSFIEALENPLWTQHLRALKPDVQITAIPKSEVPIGPDFDQSIFFSDYLGEELILAEYENSESSMHSDKLPPPHPGDVLKVILGDISATDFVEWTGLGRFHIPQLLAGESRVSRTLANRLSEIFGTDPRFWTGLQKKHDLWLKRNIVPES